MMDFTLVEVDFDDPTTNVRGRRALAIAKWTPRGYWPRRSTINLTTRACFLRANEEQARNWDCNLDIANIRWKLYWSRWGSVTPLSGRWTQTKYAKLQLWRTFNLNKTQSLNDTLRAVYMEEEGGGFRGPWGWGPKPTLTLVSPHIRTLKTAYTQVFRNYMGLAQ